MDTQPDASLPVWPALWVESEPLTCSEGLWVTRLSLEGAQEHFED